MIDKLGSSMQARLGAVSVKGAAKSGAPAAVASTTAGSAQGVASPASALAAEGAPVDLDKVAQIRAKIADGSYKVDADAVAEKMITLDLEARRA